MAARQLGSSEVGGPTNIQKGGEMSDIEKIVGINDDSKPNMGRIYDFFLGGNHNFEVDRHYAEKVLEELPLAPKMARLVRWFLVAAARTLSSQGFTQFVDFASGLPVSDHIHHSTPPGTKVVYSDNDDVTVAYGQDILGETQYVLYLKGDVKDPLEILNDEQVSEFLDRSRKTAIGLNGITYFMEDEQVRLTTETLFEWANKGDRLFLCDSSMTSLGSNTTQIYRDMKTPINMHSEEQMSRLVGRWTPVKPGYRLLEEWVKIDGTSLSIADQERTTVGGNFYGVIYEKR